MSETHRDQLIASVNNESKSGAAKTWANVDRPIDIRTAEAALFGIKRMLVQWGYNKPAIRVNKDTRTLSVANQDIVKATVVDFVLRLEWCDGQWEQWQDLQSSPDLSSVTVAAQGKLDKAKNAASGAAKGKGKSFE